MKMPAGAHWCQEGSHKPIDTTSVPRHRLPFHSSRKNHQMEPVCAPCLSPGTTEELSGSASSLENIPITSPQELGLGSQQSKGHPSAFTQLQYFMCCLLLCFWAWQHSPAPTHGEQPCESSLCTLHLSHWLETKPWP